MVLFNGIYQIRDELYAQQNHIELLEDLYKNDSSLSLDKIYYNQSSTDNIHNIINQKGSIITKGRKVGFFKALSTQSPGFEVVLDATFLNNDLMNLSFAKKVEHKINVTFDPAYNPGNEPRNILAKREKIHGFIDPAVFWGMQFFEGIKYEGTIYSAKQHTEDFYNKFINPFITKGIFYLDIRNNLDYSLNYFNDQQINNNNIGTNYNHRDLDSAVFSDVSYYTNYWPICIRNTPIVGNNNHVILNTRFINQNFISPIIYLDYGIVPKSCKWNQGYANSSTATEFSLANTPELQFLPSQKIQLIQPCVVIGNDRFAISWFSRLYYFDGKINDGLNRFHKTPFDYIFGAISEKDIGHYVYNSSSTQNYNVDKVLNRYDQRKICVPEGRGVDYPLIVQTGLGLSASTVTFYGKVVNELYAYEPPRNDSFLSILSGSNVIDTNQKTPYFNYGKYQTPSFGLVFQKMSLNGKTFQLHLSAQEIFTIQEVIRQKQNSNFPNPNPLPTDINVTNQQLRFVFEIFQNSSNAEGFYFGQGFIKLAGMDHIGNEVIISDLQIPTANLFVHTTDWINFSSLLVAGQLIQLEDLLEENPYPEFTTTELVAMLQVLIDNYVDDIIISPGANTLRSLLCETFISSWRMIYYGSHDKSKGSSRGLSRAFLRFEPFDMAIPNAPKNMHFGLAYIKWEDKIDQHLRSSANENSLRDNPSPYILDPAGDKIDLGHLLYGLDGLIHDYASTHDNFKKLSILYSNDFTGYIADFVPPAAEARLYDHGYKDKFEEFHYPVVKDFNRFYAIHAPVPDILSDADAFGVFRVYKYFMEHSDSVLLPEIKGERILTVQFLMYYYYNQSFNLNDTTNFPVASNYQLRWLNFCIGYDINGGIVENPLPNGNELVYQGFIEKNIGTAKFEWVADNINVNGTEHQSKAKLRKRAEAFAHFWYQFRFQQKAIVGVLWDGQYSNNAINLFSNEDLSMQDFPDLLRNSPVKPIRFERVGNPTLVIELCKYIESNVYSCPTSFPTNSTEIDIVLNKFLGDVKNMFLNEKSQMGY